MKENKTHQNCCRESADATALLRKVSVATGVAIIAVTAATQASTDYGPAIWNPLPDYGTSGSGHKFHVCHDIEGYYASLYSVLKNNGYSVHYGVNGKKDNSSDAAPGEISQFVRDANYAWHARCWNNHSTGTEHEGFASNPAWYTEEQYKASAGITRNLSAKFGWAKDRNHVVAHGQKSVSGWPAYASANLGIDPYCNTHTDPGPYWDWSHYMELCNGTAGVAGKARVCDFDNDGISDYSLWRPSTGTWYVWGVGSPQWGVSGDIPVPGDYNGDGKTDYGVWRPSDGGWHVSGMNVVYWGTAGDIPVPGDYNGDGKTDYAVFRPSTSEWIVAGGARVAYGASTDIPIPGDYNGDRKTDFAVWRPSTGVWYCYGISSAPWGVQGDIPLPFDFNGDGKTEHAVFRPSTGQWLISGMATVTWGGPGDVPVPGDFNGDGKADYAIWRPSTSEWKRGTTTVTYGASTDIPLPLPWAIWKRFF
jgi:hypothetical protein